MFKIHIPIGSAATDDVTEPPCLILTVSHIGFQVKRYRIHSSYATLQLHIFSM